MGSEEYIHVSQHVMIHLVVSAEILLHNRAFNLHKGTDLTSESNILVKITTTFLFITNVYFFFKGFSLRIPTLSRVVSHVVYLF